MEFLDSDCAVPAHALTGTPSRLHLMIRQRDYITETFCRMIPKQILRCALIPDIVEVLPRARDAEEFRQHFYLL